MAHYQLLHTTSALNWIDKGEALKVRLGIGRNRYHVAPGLYALGSPDPNSHVLVTANYKLTFDHLRSKLEGLDAWILVLDTKGVNVWCAAGKGTFGTDELLRAIKGTKLEEVVVHRNLILPQLGAPGIAGHKVTRLSGFRVHYGPVRASDIPLYLANECTASEEMRTVTFTLAERVLVAPVEMKYGIKLLPILFVLLLLYNGLPSGQTDAITISLYQLLPYVVAFLLGTFGIAILLPYLPGRSFALKGSILGVIWAALVYTMAPAFMLPVHPQLLIGHGLIMTAITAFFSLNFTGSTTYTSLSGVQKETVFSIPIMGVATLAGFVLLALFKARG